MSETVRFQEVRRTITKRGQCPVCGKRVQRSTTMQETVNPWNVNDDGTEAGKAGLGVAWRGLARQLKVI